MFGPDHKASMEIKDFKKFVENLKKVKIILGKHIKAPTKDEKKYKNFIRCIIYSYIDKILDCSTFLYTFFINGTHFVSG